jgi:WD40 repeat protein
VTNAPDGWVQDFYTLPGFDLAQSFPLPTTTPDVDRRGGAVTRLANGRLYAVSDSRLSVWDAATGAPIAGPVPVALPGNGLPSLEVRPGHPDEVALVGADFAVELWNAVTGQRLLRFQPPETRPAAYGFVFDRSGDRLVTLGATMDVWDVDHQRLARPSVPVPYEATLEGMTADGHVLLHSVTGAGNRLVFWNIDAGREDGDVLLSTHLPGAMSADGRTVALDSIGGTPTMSFALSPQDWRDRLCTFADRPFAGRELDALPPGFDPGSPCS